MVLICGLCSLNGIGQAAEHSESPVHWVTLAEALELSKSTPKKIMIDVYTHWCGPCKTLTQNTFYDNEVSEYLNTHFYSVKFNAESADTIYFDQKVFTNPDYKPSQTGRNSVHEFTRYLGVSAYPTVLFLDENAKLLLPAPGYRTPPQIELYLRLVAENHYQQIATTEQWQAWQAKFVPSWE